MHQISHITPFVAEMCTHVHISVTKWCIVGYETGALWDLYNRFIEMVQIIEKHPDRRQEPVYFMWSVSSLLMTWPHQEPGYHQTWYWPCTHRIFRYPHGKGGILYCMRFIFTSYLSIGHHNLIQFSNRVMCGCVSCFHWLHLSKHYWKYNR